MSDHFDGVRFFLPGASTDRSRSELLRLFFRTPFAKWPAQVANPAPARLEPRVDSGRLRVTSIGHASHLIQTCGLNILVDPVWSKRASPLAFAGPKRVAAPGLALAALPPIDVILVTHNHYDHLDLATLDALHAAHAPRLIVPLGNDSIIKRHNRKLAPEAFDWADRVALGADVAVTLVPCHHWSARGLGDRRMALWAAFVLETPDGAIYHVGDTAFADGAVFREIPQRFGRPRLAILPIGAYAPRWFMRNQHVDPEESVAIFEACRAHFALAHHWGTFQLTAEPMEQPVERLHAALDASGIPRTAFRTQRPGEAFEVPRPTCL